MGVPEGRAFPVRQDDRGDEQGVIVHGSAQIPCGNVLHPGHLGARDARPCGGEDQSPDRLSSYAGRRWTDLAGRPPRRMGAEQSRSPIHGIQDRHRVVWGLVGRQHRHADDRSGDLELPRARQRQDVSCQLDRIRHRAALGARRSGDQAVFRSARQARRHDSGNHGACVPGQCAQGQQDDGRRHRDAESAHAGGR